MVNINKIKTYIYFALVAVLLVSSLGFTGLFKANAQEETGGSGLSISPTRTELSVLAGSKDVVTVSIENITSGQIFTEIYIDDFEPDNVTGEPRLVTEDRKTATSVSEFVTVPEGVSLAPGESADITLPVSVPNNAAPGGYFGAVRFKAVPVRGDGNNSDGGSEVSLTANILSLILIEVPGDITQKVSVNSVKAYLNDSGGSIFTKIPNFVGIEIENQGNGFVKPFGTVIVSGTSGKEIFSYEINDSNPRSNVLPFSKRLFKDQLLNIERSNVNGKDVETKTSPITWPGKYTITANVSYGNGGEVFTVNNTFWYIPSWLIVVLLLILLIVVGGSFYLYRKYVTKSMRRRR